MAVATGPSTRFPTGAGPPETVTLSDGLAAYGEPDGFRGRVGNPAESVGNWTGGPANAWVWIGGTATRTRRRGGGSRARQYDVPYELIAARLGISRQRVMQKE